MANTLKISQTQQQQSGKTGLIPSVRTRFDGQVEALCKASASLPLAAVEASALHSASTGPNTEVQKTLLITITLQYSQPLAIQSLA